MTNISVKLSSKYKSFEPDEFNLEGGLIILTGVNGSGKSQFLDIIYKSGHENNSIGLAAIDSEEISKDRILYKSFKDCLNISELTRGDVASLSKAKDRVLKLYNFCKLNHTQKLPSHMRDIDDPTKYTQVCKEAKKILIEKYHQDKFNHLSSDQVRDAITYSFIFAPDDVFTNNIGDIFFNYATKVLYGCANAGEKGGAPFDKSTLGIPPWDVLNSLFESLGFEYRFKNNYQRINDELNEQPKLYALKTNENNEKEIDEAQSRGLSELSDGEKAIISLSFASFNHDAPDTKMLLLDEYDATLNPSLIEAFFKVLDIYFRKKGIIIILTTHSTDTLILCPPEANLYQVMKPGRLIQRIQPLDKAEYEEYKKIHDQHFKDNENFRKQAEQLLKALKQQNEPLIITEGKTDWKYFIKALEYFQNKELREFLDIKSDWFLRFGNKEDFGVCGTNHTCEMSDNTLKKFLTELKNVRANDTALPRALRLGIFDSDNSKLPLVQDKENKVFSFKISPNGISSEFLFSNDEIKALVDGRRLYIGTEFDSTSRKHHQNSDLNIGGDNSSSNKAGKKVIIDCDVFNRESKNIALSKDAFAQAIFNDKIKISDQSWENFRHIFENIENWRKENF